MPAVLTLAASLMGPVPVARAQDDPAGALEAYLESRGMDWLLAAHLREQMQLADAQRRTETGERLGRLYARMLRGSTDSAQRQELERLSNELLDRMPAATNTSLRLALAEAAYDSVADTCEQVRLLLAGESDKLAALSSLGELMSRFDAIAASAELEIRRLEPRELRGDIQRSRAEAERLDEARTVRSRAAYHAGWARYYAASLTGDSSGAREAIGRFGIILNPPDGPPRIDELENAEVNYEHIAWAAVGVALAHTVADRGSDARLWLDTLASRQELNAGVRARLFRWQVIVLASARDWDEVVRMIDRQREEHGGLLALADARLVAVYALGALREAADLGRRAEPDAAVSRCAEAALSDLIVGGAVAHVIDLARRFGTLPLATDGFVPRYVRGLQAREEALALSGGQPPTVPATDERAAELYREAARLLASAWLAEDSSRTPGERGEAGLLAAECWYLGSEKLAAVDQFERVFEESPDRDQREVALWNALIRLGEHLRAVIDRGLPDDPVAIERRRAGIAALFLSTFPDSERAAALTLQATAEGGVDPEQAARILDSVAPDSPLYTAARRQLCNVLYAIYRRTPSAPDRASGDPRSLAAERFLGTADAVLTGELAALSSAGAEERDTELIVGLLALAQRVLQVAVEGPRPAPDRAEAAFRAVDRLVAFSGQPLAEPIRAELVERRIQLAAIERRWEDVDRLTHELGSIGGGAAGALHARRFAFREAVRAREQDADPRAAADRVVDLGRELLPLDGPAVTPDTDTFGRYVAVCVARAAAYLWEQWQDAASRDLAIAIDRALSTGDRPDRDAVERLARLLEPAGDLRGAASAWANLSAATAEATEPWFEARYNVIRLTFMLDPERAMVLLEQHVALYPELGPPPWRDRFSELRARPPQRRIQREEPGP